MYHEEQLNDGTAWIVTSNDRQQGVLFTDPLELLNYVVKEGEVTIYEGKTPDKRNRELRERRSEEEIVKDEPLMADHGFVHEYNADSGHCYDGGTINLKIRDDVE